MEGGERKSLQTDRLILVPGPESEIEIVRRIYESLVIEGKTEFEIVADLIDHGIVGEEGASVDASSSFLK